MTSPTQETSQDTIDRIKALLDRSVDAREGFETVVEKAKPAFRPVAKDFLDLHRAHVDRITGLLSSMGGETEMPGTAMSSVNRAVVTLRSLLDEIDHDVLENIRSGEQHVVAAFDDVLSDPGIGAAQQDFREMKSELTKLLDVTRAM